MPFIRQIYDDLPDIIQVPGELKHRRAEVIILPLDKATTRPKKSTLKTLLAELVTINIIEPIEIECPQRLDRANPFLDEGYDVPL